MTVAASAASPPASPTGQRRVLVVTPTYNEAENLPELVRRLVNLRLPGLELIVVDDNSPDGTAAVAERLSAQHGLPMRVLRRPSKLGLGSAYKAGFREALRAGADYIIQMDADLSHAPEYVPAMLARAEEADVVVGSRWAPGGGADPAWGLARRLLSRAGALYARLVLDLPVKDVTTGFKCFRREALAAIDLAAIQSRGFAFQIEMAYICQCRGYRVVELPIQFANRAKGRSKLSARVILEAFLRVLVLRLHAPRASPRHHPS